jgi:hypothetical protein
MRDPNNPETLLILGERKVHMFDMKKMEFVSCLDDEECFMDRRQELGPIDDSSLDDLRSYEGSQDHAQN